MGQLLKSLPLLLSLISPAFAEDAPAPASFAICKDSKGNVRTVRVEKTAEGCHTLYSKEGAEKAIGGGRNHDSCVHFFDNVKANLEKSNWKCHDVEAASSTDETAI